MGAVNAKQKVKSNETGSVERDEELPPLNLGTKARVDRVSFNGIKRTKSPLLNFVVSPLFNTDNFEDVIKTTHEVRTHLQRLGVFKKIAVDIETSKGPNSSPDVGYEVTFHVTETNWISALISTVVSNNEAMLVIGGSLPNTFGNGEIARGEYTFGTKRTSNKGFTFSKPFLSKYNPIGSVSLFQNDSDWPISGYKLRDTGLLMDMAITSTNQVKQNFQYELDWRQLFASKFAAFEVTEDAGHKLKSATRYIFTFDQRDHPIFPTSGSMIKGTVEYSGLGGNIRFLKGDLGLQWNFPVTKDVVFQVGYNFGHMYKWDESHTIADNFFLGGPLDVRGFDFRSLGPQKDGCFVGGSTYYAGSLHIYSPLPFRPGEGGLGDLFRTHLWINAGNCGDFPGKDGENPFDRFRVAAGLGIAIKLANFARAEINYCFPIKAFGGDVKVNGIQFGVGMNFL